MPERLPQSARKHAQYRRQRIHPDERVRIVCVNYEGAVPRVCLVGGLSRLGARQIKRHEHHIQPNRRQHQSPQRGLWLTALDRGSKAKMTGDHDRGPRLRAFGHGTRRSTNPTTTTKRKTPRMNCT